MSQFHNCLKQLRRYHL